jgi:tetratricopeptide (TPR) repeat protein
LFNKKTILRRRKIQVLSSRKTKELGDKVEELYKVGKHREVILRVDPNDIPSTLTGDKIRLRLGWAHYQLGEQEEALVLFSKLAKTHLTATEIGEGSTRGLAHIWIQRGKLSEAEDLIKRLPVGFNRDNTCINLYLAMVRKEKEIPVGDVMCFIANAIIPPYAIINAHIVNNGSWVLFQARKQPETRELIPTLPGYFEKAKTIYQIVNAQQNHIASILYRQAVVYEFLGEIDKGLDSAEESKEVWLILVSSQGGERYQQNLKGAEDLRVRLQKQRNK